MATAEGTNYYNAMFEYSMRAGEEGTDVNLKYDFIINCIDVKRRIHNYFLREEFDVDKMRERGDKGLFAATLRPSFDYCRSPEIEEYPDEDRYLYEGSSQTINGIRYEYWVNYDKTKYVMVGRIVGIGTKCNRYNLLGCAKQIQCITYGERSPCDATEVVRTLMPSGKSIDQGKVKIKNEKQEDGTYRGVVIIKDFTGLHQGAYITISEVISGTTVPNGQSRKLSNPTGDGNYYVDEPWLGLDDEDDYSVINIGGYTTVDTVASFVGERGIAYMSKRDCSEQVVYSKAPGSVTPISSICSGNKGEIFFIEGNKLKIFGGMSGYDYEKTEFEIGSDHDALLRVNQYIVLLGENNISIGYYSGENVDKKITFDITYNVAGFGYFNKGSYVYNNTDGFTRGSDQFVLANSRGILRNYEIIPKDDRVSQIGFSLNWSDVGKNYVATELRSLRRDRGDKLYFSSDPELLFMFMVNDNGKKIKTNAIVKYIQHYNHYMKRQTCADDIVILGQENYRFHGNADYVWGKKLYDTNKSGEKFYIYQGVGITFGDLTENSPKALLSLDIPLGEDTHFSGGNHQLTIDALSRAGYSEVITRRSLHRTQYIKDLNAVRNIRKGRRLFREDSGFLLLGEGLYTRQNGVEKGYNNKLTQNKQQAVFQERCERFFNEYNQHLGRMEHCQSDDEEMCEEIKKDHGGSHEELFSSEHIDEQGMMRKALRRGRYGVIHENPGIDFEGCIFQISLECNHGDYFTLHGLILGYVQKDPEEFHSVNVIPHSRGEEPTNKLLPQ